MFGRQWSLLGVCGIQMNSPCLFITCKKVTPTKAGHLSWLLPSSRCSCAPQPSRLVFSCLVNTPKHEGRVKGMRSFNFCLASEGKMDMALFSNHDFIPGRSPWNNTTARLQSWLSGSQAKQEECSGICRNQGPTAAPFDLPAPALL